MRHSRELPWTELNNFLVDFNGRCDDFNSVSLDVNSYIAADYIASMLLVASFDKPKLTREYIKKLHAGSAEWKVLDGSYRKINESFDFDLLEGSGVIYFECDCLRVSSKYIRRDESAQVHETVAPMLRFIHSLVDIVNGNGDFEPIKLVVKKCSYDSIVPNNYKFEHVVASDMEDSECVELSFETLPMDMRRLIADFFWSKIIKFENIGDAVNKYYDVAYVCSDLVSPPKLSLFNCQDRNKFSNICLEVIRRSAFFDMPLSKFERVINCERDLYSVIGRRHNTNIVGGSCIDYISGNIALSEISNECCSRFLNGHEINNLELIESDRLLGTPYFNGRDIICLLLSIIKNDLAAGELARENSSLDSLLNESGYNETLRLYLTVKVSDFISDGLFDIYLLLRANEFEFGVVNIIRRVKDKYISSRVSFSEVKSNISFILSEIIISVAVNNNKLSELASLLAFLAKSYVKANGDNDSFEKTLVENLVNLLSKEDFRNLSMAMIDTINQLPVSNAWPYYTIYLLFIFRETSLQKYGGKLDDISVLLGNAIYSEYEKHFKFSLEEKTSCLRANNLFDSLKWSVCDEGFLVDKFINLCPKPVDLISRASSDASNAIYYVQAIGSYFQVLMNLHSLSNANKNQIECIIRDLIKYVGFECDNIHFPLFSSRFIMDKYDLWARFSKVANDFDDSVFNDIVTYVSGFSSLQSMMTLYSNTYKHDRINKVEECIDNRRDWMVSNDCLPAIESAFLSALEQNKLSLARIALTAAEDFISKSQFKSDKRFKREILGWRVNSFKYALLSVYYSNKPSESKVREIDNIELPVLEFDEYYHGEGNPWVKEVTLFKSYLRGLLILSDNPSGAVKIFEDLNSEYENPMFSHLVFLSKFHALVKDDNSSPGDYSNLLLEYKRVKAGLCFNEWPLNHKSDFLAALLLARNYAEVISECDKLAPSDKFFRSITITYCRALREKNNHTEALRVIDNYKAYHSVNMSDEELDGEISSINAEIEKATSPIQLAHVRADFLISSSKSSDELKVIYHQIITRPVSDLAIIVGASSNHCIEDFLYSLVSPCLKEILKRTKNLARLNNHRDENAINDWFTSLFNQRAAFVSIKLSDQARIGSSNSEKGVGETDGLIIDRNGNSISIFEAFNLSSIERGVISTHLNKMSKYDRESLSPVFIVAYCYFDCFASKTEEYSEYVSGLQYNGFAFMDEHNHKVDVVESGSHLVVFKELRLRGAKEVTIYHFLIDLKLSEPE